MGFSWESAHISPGFKFHQDFKPVILQFSSDSTRTTIKMAQEDAGAYPHVGLSKK
jgi:hypothetical protein